ncbi:MAG: hypothetical protein K0S00_3421 [Xanthobacteraceae bacterium]|nr:hypothetical protein [Xanthobacteraceae bacterium]
MRLVEYPYVLVRFSCTMCRRRGQMRLVRLAEKYGADTSMLTVLNNVAWSCSLPRKGSEHRKPQKYGARCGIFLPDLGGSGPPPDMPPVGLRLVKPDAAE